MTSLGTSGAWAYDSDNQLDSYGDVSYTYDANGNTVEKLVGTRPVNFTYDGANQLVKVTDASGNAIAQYGYDPFGRRIWKEVNGVRTYFFYSAEGLIGEFDSTGKPIRTYGYAPGSTWTTDPLFITEGGQYYYYQGNRRGAPVELIAANGAVVWSADYTAFGQALVGPSSTVSNPLRFPGQYYDAETGLNYNWHRYYDPSTGRYIQSDPIGLLGGVNLYAYVQDDPVNLIDPSGRIVAQIIGGLIGGGLAAYVGIKSGQHGWQLAETIFIGIGTGILSTIPIPGINPILSGAVVGGMTGGLGNLLDQAARPGRCGGVNWGSVEKSVLAGTIGGAVGSRVADAEITQIIRGPTLNSVVSNPVFTDFGQKIVGATTAGAVSGSLDVALH